MPGDRLLPAGLSPATPRADNSSMGRMRGAGLIASVVVAAGLWIYGHGGGTAQAPASTNAYCTDVSSVEGALTVAKQGGAGTPGETAKLARIGSRLQADAAAQQ